MRIILDILSKLPIFRFSQLDTEYLLQWEAETESDVSEWVILVSRDSQSEARIGCIDQSE